MRSSKSKKLEVRLETLLCEKLLWDLRFVRVAGVDEAGLGPLAGPVVAGAAVFPPHYAGIPGVDDSKKLTATRRTELERRIRDVAISCSIGVVEVSELEAMGIREAGLQAMRRAVDGLSVAPDYLLVDARTVPDVAMAQSGFVRGDASVHCIGAASILAKVHRDKLMTALDLRYPEYGFARHMGYGTAAHLAALELHGPCSQHRASFAPIRRLLARNQTNVSGAPR